MRRIAIIFASIFCGLALGGFGYIGVLPLIAQKIIENRQTRCVRAEFRCAPWGVFAHQRPTEFAGDFLDPAPNVDALLSSAWVDLSKSPYALRIPAMADRAYAIEFADETLARFAGLGLSDFGENGGLVLLAGPNWSGSAPPEALLLRAPTSRIYIAARMSVRDAADVKNANALQDRLFLTPF